MLVTVLWRMEGMPEAGQSAFADVAPGAWYQKAVAWAAASGIADGYGDGRFGPGDRITRQQMAAVFHRYAILKGLAGGGFARIDGIADYGDISHWAREAMSWSVGAGLIFGDQNGRLLPRDTATRAQTAAVIARFIELAE